MSTKADENSSQILRKAAVVEEIKARLADAEAAVLTEYRGLTVGDLAELRAALRPVSTEYKVYKNSLARRAVEQVGLAELHGSLEGPVAIAFVSGDAVGAAKALRDFSRTNPNLVLKGGLLGQSVLSATQVEALADVPAREVLLARLARGFQAPLVKAAGLFQAITRNFAFGLKAYADQRAVADRWEPGVSPPSPVENELSEEETPSVVADPVVKAPES